MGGVPEPALLVFGPTTVTSSRLTTLTPAGVMTRPVSGKMYSACCRSWVQARFPAWLYAPRTHTPVFLHFHVRSDLQVVLQEAPSMGALFGAKVWKSTCHSSDLTNLTRSDPAPVVRKSRT
jgi:hypothetical protein